MSYDAAARPDIDALKAEVKELKEQVKTLTMKLEAVQTQVNDASKMAIEAINKPATFG